MGGGGGVLGYSISWMVEYVHTDIYKTTYHWCHIYVCRESSRAVEHHQVQGKGEGEEVSFIHLHSTIAYS